MVYSLNLVFLEWVQVSQYQEISERIEFLGSELSDGTAEVCRRLTGIVDCLAAEDTAKTFVRSSALRRVIPQCKQLECHRPVVKPLGDSP